ncbi:MAG: hypothetical protein KME32_09370 [Mojavia pulchra JT2-VF2]|uniref:Uncharacterized protein n=1 Tax=Mojavia pulchra JT2-VF2 TaxID=287848 RepID=A0A951PWY7_9NOST|nr:hypothetical protein [Mojavia pulchra JT2-VF2]
MEAKEDGASKGLPSKKIFHRFDGRGAGSRGRESRFEGVKLDNLFFGVP